MPRLSEKNACPMALSTTCGVTFEKSGLKRKLSPSAAPGISMELMQNAAKITNSSGISTLAIRSIPFSTPRLSTK